MQIIQNGRHDVIGKHISLVLWHKKVFWWFLVLIFRRWIKIWWVPDVKPCKLLRICKLFKMAAMHDVIDKHSNLDLFCIETLYSFLMFFFSIWRCWFQIRGGQMRNLEHFKNMLIIQNGRHCVIDTHFNRDVFLHNSK